MTLWRSVLCPVDYSENSRRALRYAAALASHAAAPLRIVYVIEAVLASAAASLNLDPLDDLARKELDDFVSSALPARAPWRPPIALDLRVGAPHEQILACAREHGSDLIVMGTCGWSGYRKLLFGSTTGRVLREATIPVLAVPATEREAIALDEAGPVFDFRSIVAAIDPAQGTAAFLEYAVGLAETLAVPLLLLHVVREVHAPPRWQTALEAHSRIAVARARRQLDLLAAGLTAGQVLEKKVEIGQPAEQIAAVAAERDAGLIVLGLRGATGLLGPRAGSIAYRALGLARMPVLLVPLRRAEHAPGGDAPDRGRAGHWGETT